MGGEVNCRLICVVALVLVVGAEFCSASGVAWGKKKPKPLAVFAELYDTTIRYKPKELLNMLSPSHKWLYPSEVARILAATSNKDKPNTIANKYSINDLLAMNEIHAKDFTPEKFNARLAMCESLSPEHVERPASDFADKNSHQAGWKNNKMDKEDGTPSVLVYHKNLHEYCVKAFYHYYRKLRQEMRVDEELDSKVMQLEAEVHTFRRKHLFEYPLARPGETFQAHIIMVDFLKEKQPEEVEQIKASCSELIDKVGFVAERELFNLNGVPLRYSYVNTYCKGIFYQGS